MSDNVDNGVGSAGTGPTENEKVLMVDRYLISVTNTADKEIGM